MNEKFSSGCPDVDVIYLTKDGQGNVQPVSEKKNLPAVVPFLEEEKVIIDFSEQSEKISFIEKVNMNNFPSISFNGIVTNYKKRKKIKATQKNIKNSLFMPMEIGSKGKEVIRLIHQKS